MTKSIPMIERWRSDRSVFRIQNKAALNSALNKLRVNSFPGHEGRPGEVGGSLPRGAQVQIKSLTDKILAAGASGEVGFSYQPFSDNYPTTGVMSSEFPERNKPIPVKDFTEEKLIEYILENADALADPANYLGGWVQYGQIDLDISRRFDGLDEALKSAAEHFQAGVFSLDEMKTYYVSPKFDPSSPEFDQKFLDEFRAGKRKI